MAEDTTDYLKESGARELAFRIREYWAGLGCRVEVRVEEEKSRSTSIWAIRSGLGLYLPPPAARL